MTIHVTIHDDTQLISELHIVKLQSQSEEPHAYLVSAGGCPQTYAEWQDGTLFTHNSRDSVEICILKALEALRDADKLLRTAHHVQQVALT